MGTALNRRQASRRRQIRQRSGATPGGVCTQPVVSTDRRSINRGEAVCGGPAEYQQGHEQVLLPLFCLLGGTVLVKSVNSSHASVQTQRCS